MTAMAETFDGIVGNEAAIRALAKALDAGVSHAYLFHGPPGVGKRTVARRFGAALVAGGDLVAEERARRGLHPDLSEIRPEGMFTLMDQVREVVKLASSRPFEGARRVIMLDADSFNAESANALLKTLEEPEGETVFILFANAREGVMPTISSRAQSIRFDPVPRPEVAEFLRTRGADEPELYAALGRGSVGLSVRYAEEGELRSLRDVVFRAAFSFDEDFEGRYKVVEEIVDRAKKVGEAREKAVLEGFEEPDLRTKEEAKRAERAGKAARDGAVREAVELLAMLFRDAGVVRFGAGDLVSNVDRVGEIEAAVERTPDADWAGASASLEEARTGLAYNVSSEATLEVALSLTRRQILGFSRGS
ncbi:MAG: AAA family ATPase [Actinomycetota bacterium]|jgi:DNA polymerase-3 subunit delta'|nr:AAA family ATPase [Rubrobacter sp.]MDQ3509042.1 AAA family ATPase [Actinomycetota bacterium]